MTLSSSLNRLSDSLTAERAMDTLNHTVIKGKPCRIMWSQRDPTLRRSNNGNLYVKNLDKGVDNRALHETFSLFGNILSCKVATDETGKSKGYGFVHFETDEAARSAVKNVNGMKIGNKIVYVGPFCKKTERQSGKAEFFTNLYVRSFPPTWTEKKLEEIFGQYGETTSIWLNIDKHGRPYACVNFSEADCAKRCLQDLNGRKCSNDGLLPIEEETSAETTKVVDAPAPSVGQTAAETEAAPTAGEKAKEDGADPAADKETGDVAAKMTDTNDTSNDKNNASANTKDVYTLFVDRAQDRAERGANMKHKFDQKAQQLKAQYEGVNLYIKNLSDSVSVCANVRDAQET